MRLYLNAFAFFIFAFSTIQVSALTLSFKEAEQKLLAQSSELKQEKQEVEIANANLRVGYAAIFPKASANWADQKRGDLGWTQSYSLDVEASLFAGGAEYSTIAALKSRQESAEYSLKDFEDSLRIRLARTMLSGSLASGKLEILKRTKKTIDDRVKEQRRRLRLGQVREPDLLQTEMESLRLDRTIISLEQELLQSGSELKSLLAMQATDPVDFAPLESLTNEIEQSLNPRSDYLLGSLRKEQEALKYDGRSTWRSHLPTLSAFAKYGDVGSTEMGLKAQWVFFEGLELPSQVRKANAQSRIIDERVKQADLDRTLQVDLKKTELINLSDRIHSVKRAKEMARKAFNVQQIDYRRGIVNELEVLSSIQNYLELQTEELDLMNQIALTHVSGLELGAKL